MKSNFLIFIGFLLITVISSFGQKGVVNNGAKIIIDNGAVMKITGADGNYTNNTSGTDGRIDLDGKIRIEGDWINNATSGSVFINVDNDGEVIFEGSNVQYIQGNTTGFEKITTNNANGLILQSNTDVNGDFTLTNGRVSLGAYNLTLGTASSVLGTLSSSNMFVATGSGQLRKLFSSAGSFVFPVGDMTGTYEYSPITLNFTSGTFGGSAYAGVRLVDAKHPNNNALTSYISRYWSVSQSDISGFSCDVTGTYLTADVNGTESSMFTGKWNSPNWIKLDAVNTASNQISGTVDNFGDFTAGDQDMFCSPAIVLGSTVTDVTCYGGNDGAIDLSVTNGLSPYTYDWTTSGGSGLTPGVEDQSGLSEGTYSVTVTDYNGCTATEDISVTFLNNPTADAGADDDLCPGQTTVQLGATGGTSYSWSPTTGLSNPSIANPIADPTTTTTYTVTVTDAAGCTDADDVIITVNTLPTANAGTDQTICNGESTTIVATGGNTYLWDNGLGSGASHSVSPASTTTYTVTVTDGNGCTDADNVIVNVNDLPVVDAGTDQSIPNGTSTTLDATVTGGSGSYTYSWTPAGDLVDPSVVDPTTQILSTTTTFTLQVTDAVTGCQNSDDVVVTITGGALSAAPYATLSTICNGETTTLYANASGGSGSYTYNWSSSPGSFSSTNANPSDSPTATTTYTVTVDDGFTSVVESVVVTVNPLPTADAGADQAICNGEFTTLTATGGSTYDWDNGLGSGATQNVAPTITTTYNVTVTDVNGCSDTDNTIVTVYSLPVADAGTNQDVCDGNSVTIDASGSSGFPTLTYNWDNGLGSGVSHVVTPASTTTYNVTVTDGHSCSSTDNVTVTVLTVPVANAGTDKTICEGSSATLNASGGATYLWDNGLGTGASHTVSPTVTTIYTVTVTAANGCTDDDNVTVNVNPLPIADAGTDVSVCDGESVTLTATGGTNYAWDGGIDQGVPFIPTVTTTYTVTVTDANGCSDTDDVIVTVNTLPTADAGANQEICEGESTSLTATGGSTYYWSTTDSTASISVSPTTTTTYSVTVTATNGCTDDDNVTVTVNPLPIPDAGTDQTICEGDDVTLTASGGTSYNWDNGVAQGTAFTPTATNTYNVTVTDANGCTATDNVIVTVLISPTADAGTDQTICEGDDVTLIATGGVSYSWNNGVVQGNPFSPTTTDTYTVVVTGSNGCTDTDDVTVTVNPVPPAYAGTNETICNGESVILSATGGTSYVWNTTDTTASITVSPAITTTYYVTVTDSNSCTATDDVLVTVNSLPIADAGADQSVCDGESVTLTATGGTNYVWSGGVTQGVSFVPATTTTYSVTVTNSNGCTGIDTVLVTVYPLPTAVAGVDQEVCYGDDVTLTASGGINYAWSGGVTQGIPFSPVSTTDYYVTVTDTNGCTDSDTLTVTVNDLPVVDAGSNVSISNGTTTMLDATVFGGSGSYLYSWTPADSLVNATIEDPTTVNLYTTNIFTLVVTDQVTGCQSSDNITVTVTGGPLSVAPYASNDTICENDPVQLFAVPGGGSGSYAYSWFSAPAGFTSTDENPYVSPSVTTTYTVTVDDGSNTATGDVTVVVNPLPVADAGADQTICRGSSVTLTATGGISYIWSGGVTQGVAFAPTVSDLFYVTVTDTNGCSATDDVYVVVDDPAMVDAGSDIETCEEESVSIIDASFGGAANSVTWSSTGTGTFSSPASITTDYTPSPADVTAGSIYLIVTTDDPAGSCNSAIDTLLLTINAYPIAEAGVDQVVCFGEEVILTATGGDTYAWSGGVSQGTAFTPSATSEYIVTVTDVNSCSAVDTVSVTVNPLPPADAGADLSVCVGEGVTLTATGGTNYVWSGGVTQGVSFVPATTEIYYVTVTDNNGCSASDNLIVTVNDLPVVDAGTDQSIIYNTSTTLDATVSGGSGSYTYNWLPNDSLVDYTIVDPTTINLHATTVFTLEVTDAVTGCVNTDIVTVSITGGPLTATPIAVPDTICDGDYVQLYSQASGGSGTYIYAWTSNPAGYTSSSANPVVTPTANTIYILTLNDGTSTYVDSVDVIVNPLPVIDLGMDTTLCPEDTIVLSAGTGYDSYLWSTNDTTSTITVDSAMVGLSTMTYYVTVTNNGCETVDQISITYDVCSGIDFADGSLLISMYPNPSNGLIYISYNGFTKPLDIKIMDMSGKTVMYQRIESYRTEFIQKLDLSRFAEGTYIIKFANDDFVHLERLILY